MSIAIPVVQSWDGEGRRIYLKSGVTSFHPVDDIYKEYRNARRTNESLRKWYPFLKADGNIPKGGGKSTERYVTLLNGMKIIPFNENTAMSVTGEIITDNQTNVFDTDLLTEPITIKITPSATEIIYIEIDGGGGVSYTLSQIADAVWSKVLP